MKHIIIPAILILAACSPSTNATPKQTEAVPAAVEPQGNWTVDSAKSHIKFTASQTGAEFTGEFKDFDAIINFDPANIEAASVTATIDMSSFEAGDDERNGALPTKDWFYVKEFPTAVFTSDEFSKTGDKAYVAKGSLSLRGVSKPVTLPFTLTIEDETAVMNGSVSLNRGDFGVGQGAWKTDEWVSLEVQVKVDITATRN